MSYCRVDSVYNFLIRWRPDLYGEEIIDESVLKSKGFVAIPEHQSHNSVKTMLPSSPMIRHLSEARLVKDWEVSEVTYLVPVNQQLVTNVSKFSSNSHLNFIMRINS